MLRRRPDRLVTTVFVFVVVSLLFAQLALARYVCPQQASVEAMAARMAAGEPCEGMDPDQPALCHQQSTDAAKSVEVAKTPAPQAAAILVLERPLPVEPKAVHAVRRATAGPLWPPPERPFLSTRRLRV